VCVVFQKEEQMVRKILGALLSVFIFISLSFASKTYLMDTTTTGILSYGSYDMGFSFFQTGMFFPELILVFLNF
jgi:hypothetical protein